MSPRAAPRPGPPGPRGVPLLGVLPQLARDPLGTLARARDRYGDVVRLPVLSGAVYLLAHPDHVERVLVTRNANHWKGRLFGRADFLFGNGLVLNDGESWHAQRRVMQPGFHADLLRTAVDAMLEVIEDHARRWRLARRDGTVLEFESEMTVLTLDLMATAMFGVRLGADELATTGRAFGVVLEHVGLRFATFTLPPATPLPGRARALRALAALEEIVARLVDRHDPARTDVLGMLQQAVDTGAMSPRQLRDEVMTLLFGGYEATAHTLAWTWHLLDRHPQVGDRVRAEVAAACPGDVAALPYTRQVLDEVLRLYPPFWEVLRSSRETDEFDGHVVPGGAAILLVPWLTHRLPEFWPDPSTFDPDRWAAGPPAHRHAYFPFGGGQRLCIGRPLALLEMQLVVSQLSREFRPRRADRRPVRERARSTLRARHGIRMVLDGT
ncbi:cytochrome P450 [Catellatospora citrea]|uniref:Cytochrome P450 n=1 Tax=Catellatospora citrea TaxID=53366 RepID=A0A8J3KRE1_9ACTN|nr:cytochrome P450 [Catellatospora citrea]RKE11455.1 cytochrome P450 [Catellatospora citrea]GIF99954.1 cytochrome P450 [Catellatospora citrea]